MILDVFSLLSSSLMSVVFLARDFTSFANSLLKKLVEEDLMPMPVHFLSLLNATFVSFPPTIFSSSSLVLDFDFVFVSAVENASRPT